MKIRFAPESQVDLDDAVQWYEHEQRGLGRRFAQVVDETVLRIARFPRFNTEVKPRIYRALVRRFPYGVFYGIEENVVMIYAIAHLHRKPFHWGDRTV